MLPVSVNKSWTCSSCIIRQIWKSLGRRGLSIAVAPSPQRSPRRATQHPLADHSAPGASHDDRTLRKIFDSRPFWLEFSQQTATRRSGATRGLFQNQYLTNPDGFDKFTAVTLERAKKLVAKILSASGTEDYKRLVRDLDRLSDLLCRVIDISDFVRSTHPDRRIQEAASRAYGRMFEYMNVLNTTTGLHAQLKWAVDSPEVVNSWSEEERVVAQILMKDFSKSAIDLPARDRQKFVDLSNDISRVGPAFVDNIAPAKAALVMDSSKLKGLDPMVARHLTKWGRATLPTMGSVANLALRSVEDSDVREELYSANRTAPRSQIRRLEEMLVKRAELAKLSDYESYGHLALEDKMAKSPESVEEFLQALVGDNKKKVQQELHELAQIKQEDTSGSMPLQPWDKEFYKSIQISRLRSKSRNGDFLPAFFSLGTVMQGLSRLFRRLYGIRFVPHETLPGETWNDDVRRLDIVDESDGHIAVVYCDLFERAGKNPNPAHFTLRCSRRIEESEIEEASEIAHEYSSSETAATDGMAATRNSKGELHQLPTIALICDFTRGPSNRPTLLSFREVQTLFHEMGHAVHSMQGRTTLQNVSGTRCATDFAELPSVLMEHFAAAPEVLALFARHWETDAPLPYQMVEEKIRIDRRFEGAETESQILLAMLDQRYHSSLPLSASFDSTKTYRDVLDTYGSLPEPAGTSWQGFFGHLFGYGSTYYSYLFDRAIAGKIWTDVFQRREGGAVSREAGTLFRDEVLKWGGGRDGWRCVAGALGREELAAGDGAAMAEVGRWGVKD